MKLQLLVNDIEIVDSWVHGGTVLLNSTDGAPGSNAGDQLVSEVMSSNEISSLLNEESDEDTTLDGAYFVQEDVGAGSTIGPPRDGQPRKQQKFLLMENFHRDLKYNKKVLLQKLLQKEISTRR